MKLTKQELITLNPCSDGLEYAASLKFNFAVIYETCERGDWLIWLLRKTKSIDKKQAVLLACECAERALMNYEKRHPGDNRPRQAIEVARQWHQNPTEENREKCKSASATSAVAAAAYGSASAAAAYADASAHAYAASASDSYASDSYAAAAKFAEQKWQAEKIREIIPNPFL